MGKPWENHGKMVIYMGFNRDLMGFNRRSLGFT